MATYTELRDLFAHGDLFKQVETAVVIAAFNVLNEASEVVARREWAESAMQNTTAEAQIMIKFILAANKGSSVAAITSATDSLVQTNIDTAVDNRFGSATGTGT